MHSSASHQEPEEKTGDSTNLAARCLDFFLYAHGCFKQNNVTRYLKGYESKMKVILVNLETALTSFLTLVEDSLVHIVLEHLETAKDDWTIFSTKVKKGFSVEDTDRRSRTIFSAWVMDKRKTHGPMELLREHELKLEQLPPKDARFIEFWKAETF